MDSKIQQLTSTTFCGKRFTRKQIAEIQGTVQTFSNLSRCELAMTICEHLNLVTPRGTNKLHTCLNVLEEMELLGLFALPPKVVQKKKVQKAILWTDKTNESAEINDHLDQVTPLKLEIVTEPTQIQQWNEFVDRYHYLGYSRPIGSHLRYYIIDRHGRKLGCLLFSFATWSLECRDRWIGWTNGQREKHLNLIINNNRFLIFPWVNVRHLASKALSLVMQQIANDWEIYHGYRPVLLETFVDSTKYHGTCYKAANWQHIGETKGKSATPNQEMVSKKDVYVYPLQLDIRAALLEQRQSSTKKAQPFKTAQLAQNSQIFLWQKIINIVARVADEFDSKWQKRKRIIGTLLLILFVFRLCLSKNKQGYGATINELWDYCAKMNIQLPQKKKKPVSQSSFCLARSKLDEHVFKVLNTEIINTYEGDQNVEYRWKQHRLFAVDGTKINLPRQLIDDSYKTPSSNSYYPQGLVSCLYQLKSKIPFDFDLSSNLNERKLALKHLDILNTNDVVVYDRGYFSYVMLHAHNQKGVQAVFRLSKKSFKVIDEFINSTHTEQLVVINPNKKLQHNIIKQYPDIEFIPLSLRLIKYVIDDNVYVIGTTLTNTTQYKTEEFPELYHSCWGVEELYKISKTLIDVEDFHGQSERGVRQELFAHFVLITLTRIFANQTNDVLMQYKPSEGAEKIKANFKNCLITVARNLEILFLRQVSYVKDTINTIINCVFNCRQKERSDRSYVRLSHKTRKKWESKKRNKIANNASVKA